MNGLGKDYIWSELFQHFIAAFLRKVKEVAHAITDLYCTVGWSYEYKTLTIVTTPISPFQVSHLRLRRHRAGDLPAEPPQQRHPAARQRPVPIGEGRQQLRDGRLLQRDHRVPGQLHGRQRRRQPHVRREGGTPQKLK